MTKKTMIIFGVSAVILLLILALSSYKSDSQEFCVFDSISGDPLCFSVGNSNDLASIVATNEAGKSTVAPGEMIKIGVYVEMPREVVPPLYTAQIYIRNEDTKQTIKIWDVMSELSAQPSLAACLKGTSTTNLFASASPCKQASITGNPRQIMSFAAPTTPGKYTVAYIIRDKKPDLVRGYDQSVLIEEYTTINVQAVGSTKCPANSYSAWTSTGKTNGGEYQQRTYLTYDSSCTESKGYEYRTVCSSGFLVKGESGSSSTGYKSCVAKPVAEEKPLAPPADDTQAEATSTDTTNAPVSDVSQPVAPVNTDTNNAAAPNNAFVQWFIDLWQSIKDFFTTTFG